MDVLSDHIVFLRKIRPTDCSTSDFGEDKITVSKEGISDNSFTSH